MGPVTRRWRRREDGQGLVEYSLILSLSAVVAVVVLVVFGGPLSELLDAIGRAIEAGGG